ncbi:MAG TPA: O-antigen ligase family protein [Bryobacteraceae bacterium]|nr:O-antigen ligase family protein [Bryobacteraceae bacterium]
MNNAYLFIIWLLMLLSAIVRNEPAPYDILLTGCFAVGLATSVLRYRKYLFAPFFLLSLFLLTNLISLAFSTDFVRGLAYLGLTAYLVMSWGFFVGFFGRFGGKGVEGVLTGWVMAATVSTAITSLVAVGFPIAAQWFVWGEGRAVGLFKDPNVFGAFLVPPALYAIIKSDQCDRAQRILWLFVSLALAIGIVLSLSRGAWANYLITMAVFLLMSRKFTLQGRISSALKVMLLIAVVLIYVVSQSDFNAVLAQRVSLQAYDEERFLTQAMALQAGLINPLGIGPGQSEVVFQYATHNLYLRLFSENGWGGFFFFVSFVTMTAFRAFRGARVNTSLQQHECILIFSALCGALVNSLFIDSLHWRHLWVLLALPWFPLGQGCAGNRR